MTDIKEKVLALWSDNRDVNLFNDNDELYINIPPSFLSDFYMLFDEEEKYKRNPHNISGRYRPEQILPNEHIPILTFPKKVKDLLPPHDNDDPELKDK